MNGDRPVLSATELYPTKCTFHRYIDFVDIARRSSARGLQFTLHRNVGHTVDPLPAGRVRSGRVDTGRVGPGTILCGYGYTRFYPCVICLRASFDAVVN